MDMQFARIKTQPIFNTPHTKSILETQKSQPHLPLHKIISVPTRKHQSPVLYRSHSKKSYEEYQGEWITCKATTSGSRSETNFVNSGQLFLTRRRKLLAFHVTNFNGSLFFSSSSETWSVFSLPSSSEKHDFLEDPSFCIGWKNLFMTHKTQLSARFSLIRFYTAVDTNFLINPP